MFEGLLAGLSALRPFAWRTALALFLFTGVLLFMPHTLAEEFALDQIITGSKTAISLLFLLSAAIISVEIFGLINKWTAEQLAKLRYKRNTLRFLKCCSQDEKSILKEYLEKESSTLQFPISGGTAPFLEGKGILRRTSNFGPPALGDSFPFSIQPVALEIIRKNPGLLE